MMTALFIAPAAGLASALMFASIISGAMIALVLFYLAPLPLTVAALAWGSLTALIGGVIAALGLGAVFGPAYMIAFGASVALPAWWLGHLALLARPGATPGALDWYPVGRILVWLAAFAALTAGGALLTLGTDEASINAALRRGLARVLSGGPDGTASGDDSRLLDALVAVAPTAATVISMLTLTLNLWLAAKVAAASGRLVRPWPDLRATALPPIVLAAYVAAIALSFAGGLVALLAQIVAAALTIAYAFTGFAVLHVITQAFSGRAFLLGVLYVATLFIGWPLIGVAGLGVADTMFGIRRSYALRHQRPPPRS